MDKWVPPRDAYPWAGSLHYRTDYKPQDYQNYINSPIHLCQAVLITTSVLMSTGSCVLHPNKSRLSTDGMFASAGHVRYNWEYWAQGTSVPVYRIHPHELLLKEPGWVHNGAAITVTRKFKPSQYVKPVKLWGKSGPRIAHGVAAVMESAYWLTCQCPAWIDTTIYDEHFPAPFRAVEMNSWPAKLITNEKCLELMCGRDEDCTYRSIIGKTHICGTYPGGAYVNDSNAGIECHSYFWGLLGKSGVAKNNMTIHLYYAVNDVYDTIESAQKMIDELHIHSSAYRIFSSYLFLWICGVLSGRMNVLFMEVVTWLLRAHHLVRVYTKFGSV